VFLAGMVGAATGVAAVVAAVIVATGGGAAREVPHGAPGTGAPSSAPSLAAAAPAHRAAPPSASAAAPSRTRPASASPDGLRDEGPFSWAPPQGWRRTIAPSAIFYHAPDGQRQIAASSGIATGADPLGQWMDSARSQETKNAEPGYRRSLLGRTTFHSHPAAVWEYTYTDAASGRPWQARQLRFTAGGKAYELDVWYDASVRTAALRAYDLVTASFTPH
jgi:eukaryotic-like serine/threonine-protein kinase